MMQGNIKKFHNETFHNEIITKLHNQPNYRFGEIDMLLCLWGVPSLEPVTNTQFVARLFGRELLIWEGAKVAII